jgi:hypothetical protein
LSASSAMVVMMGAAMSPRMIPALRMLRPTGTSKSRMIRGFMIERPMNPHTTEGIAARSSTRILRASRIFPEANSPMKMAAPREKGTETIMASPVTLAVPARRARIP